MKRIARREHRAVDDRQGCSGGRIFRRSGAAMSMLSTTMIHGEPELSVKFSKGAWPIPLRTSCKIVLMCLADRAQEEDGQYVAGEAGPSIRTISEATGLAQRSVQRALDDLLQARLVNVGSRAGGRHQQTTRYFLHKSIAAQAFGKFRSRDDPGMPFEERRVTLTTWIGDADAAARVTLTTFSEPVKTARVTLTTGTGDTDAGTGDTDDVDGCHSVTQTIIEPSVQPSGEASDTAPLRAAALDDQPELKFDGIEGGVSSATPWGKKPGIEASTVQTGQRQKDPVTAPTPVGADASGQVVDFATRLNTTVDDVLAAARGFGLGSDLVLTAIRAEYGWPTPYEQARELWWDRFGEVCEDMQGCAMLDDNVIPIRKARPA